MARVNLADTDDALVRNRLGDAIPNVSVQLLDRNGSPATVYPSLTANGSAALYLKTDREGRLTGYVDEDTYSLVYTSDGQRRTRIVAAGEAPAATPTLKALPGMVPIAGNALLPSDLYVTNGTDTAIMARVQVPIVASVALLQAIWSGRGLRQGTEVGTSATLVAEADCPDSYSVAASVETIDGRRKSLTVNGQRRWSVPVGGPLLVSDPVAIDVDVADGYFWLRVFAIVTAAGRIVWRNRHAPNVVSGQSVNRYAVDPAAPTYRSVVLGLTPSLYWPLDSTDGASDVSGNARHGIGYGGGALPTTSLGPNIGAADGIFAGGATEFDSFDDRIASTWKPFVNGTSLSASGWTYLDATDTHTLIAGDSNGGTATSFPTLRVNTDLSVQFNTRFGNGGTVYSWAAAWPGLGQWVHWAFAFDEVGNTAQLWINGVPQVAKTGVADTFEATAGNFEIGAYTTSGNPLDGRMAHVAAWTGHYLTDAEVLSIYNAAIPQAADQTQATGPLVATGSTFAGSDTCYFPALLAGTLRE